MADNSGNHHAFPHLHFENGVIRIAGGLTKRELAAMMAMQGLLSNEIIVRDLESSAKSIDKFATLCTHLATDLLKELSKREGE